VIEERAYAKANLVLRVGPPRGDGLHPLVSIFASLDLYDDVLVEEAAADTVECPGVGGDNLAAQGLAAFRAAVPDADLPPLRIAITKRIPVAAGLGGGSADAAAVLRAANELAGRPLDSVALRAVGAGIGSDVPSQVAPAHSIVTGVGETVEALALPRMALVLVPAAVGLSTPRVFAELDRLGHYAADLDPAPLRALAARPVAEIAAGLENGLEPAALSLRPELGQTLERLRAAGALAAQVTGSGPTAFGLFPDRDAAAAAAARIDGGIVAEARS
jgi:4-diphosphocytidyl-2-C-methyl-D-erythritol kinase